ncbi:MAG: biotin/lipoyl-containing protein, partial [Bacteroidota bacterium]
MARFEIVLPALGESITEATITRWLKKEGDKVSEDDPIAEIATDKVDSEIPSPVDGTLKELLFQEGEVAEVGKPIAIVMTEGEEQDAPEKGKSQAEEKEGPVAEKRSPATGAGKQAGAPSEPLEISVGEAIRSQGPSGRFYSPLVRNIAREEKISMEELDKIEGTGKEGRVTRDDMLAYLKERKHAPAGKPAPAGFSEASPKATQGVSTPQVQADSGDEVIEMTRMRKLIAEHMV